MDKNTQFLAEVAVYSVENGHGFVLPSPHLMAYIFAKELLKDCESSEIIKRIIETNPSKQE